MTIGHARLLTPVWILVQLIMLLFEYANATSGTAIQASTVGGLALVTLMAGAAGSSRAAAQDQRARARRATARWLAFWTCAVAGVLTAFAQNAFAFAEFAENGRRPLVAFLFSWETALQLGIFATLLAIYWILLPTPIHDSPTST